MRFIIAVLLLIAAPALAGVQVRDADTIVVDGTPVRLNGVDAPELGTQSGRNAKRWMVNYLRGVIRPHIFQLLTAHCANLAQLNSLRCYRGNRQEVI